MTAPDDGLEEELRRALDAAASQVEPGDSGLERILARTGRMPPRSWLASTVAEAFQRARYWTLRGHWAWQDPVYWRSGEWRSAALVARLAAARQRTATWWAQARRRGLMWTWLAAGLAATAAVTAVTAAVPPLRAAFVEVGSTVLTGGTQAIAPSFDAGPGAPSGPGQRGGTVSGTSVSSSPGVRSTPVPSGSTSRARVTVAPAPCLSWLPVTPLASTATPTASPQDVAIGSTLSRSLGPVGCPTTPAGSGPRPTSSAPSSSAPTSQAPVTPTPAASTTQVSTPTPTPTLTSPGTSGTDGTGSPASSGPGTQPGSSNEQPAPTAGVVPSGSAASSAPVG